MVVPSQPWQGAPAARAPLHPHRLTGLSESPSACPDACDAGWGNASGDRRSRCNVWPLHHQSGGAFLLPRHPHDQGETSLSPGPHRPTLCGLDAHHRSRRWTASRCVPAPCIPASSSPVDCSIFAALSPWRNVYPLATLRPCQGKTQDCAFESSVCFAMSFCACAGRKTNRLHKCFASSCGTMSRRTPAMATTHTTKPPPNRRATRRDERATGDCGHIGLSCQAVRP